MKTAIIFMITSAFIWLGAILLLFIYTMANDISYWWYCNTMAENVLGIMILVSGSFTIIVLYFALLITCLSWACKDKASPSLTGKE